MSVDPAISEQIPDGDSERHLVSAEDYLGMDAEQRYEIIKARFPVWLLTSPIQFPRTHDTFGWGCLVSQCEGQLSDSTVTWMLCPDHLKKFRAVRSTMEIDEFTATAEPVGAPQFGWGLRRKPECAICGHRETEGGRYCQAHHTSLGRAPKRAGFPGEEAWEATQKPHPPFPRCSVNRCVHDGKLPSVPDAPDRLCRTHYQQFRRSGKRTAERWAKWKRDTDRSETVQPAGSRGVLDISMLPEQLQREIRYSLYRHANTPNRTQWRPSALQQVVHLLDDLKVSSLTDAAIGDAANEFTSGSMRRRVLRDLPLAGRSLILNAELAKQQGWFDPLLVDGSQFPGTQSESRRQKPWDLRTIKQRWLRDLLWEHLQDECLKPEGHIPGARTIAKRRGGLALLSAILDQNREDHGMRPHLLSREDAAAVKRTWDLWFSEQIQLPDVINKLANRSGTLTKSTRHGYMSSIKLVLKDARDRHRTPRGMDAFVLAIPEYPGAKKTPLPRPLSYEDFWLMVSTEALAALDAMDRRESGYSDIWITQAFQGGRISETLNLKLGCTGLIGAAQPYIWRDITKVGVTDYGIACHLPVYERLQIRREKSLQRLRRRYADDLAGLTDKELARVEQEWDRTMPIFPRPTRNHDLKLSVPQHTFGKAFSTWLGGLGLSGITTHQTRATLATALLDNGAPPALVRQVLGHFSEEALAHYARYTDTTVVRHLQQVWAAGPGMDKPGTVLLTPKNIKSDDPSVAAAHIELSIVPVEHGLCRYGPVVGGKTCPWGKNCTSQADGVCDQLVLTGADLSYWERKMDAAYTFAERAPSDEARDYILSEWEPWEAALDGLRHALDELGLLDAARELDLRTPAQDYFSPLFSTAWNVSDLSGAGTPNSLPDVGDDTETA
ncbi:MAG: site-specific integrase [Actinomycetia bacterium]|nr:site-specific integrase [Actinomycetes bacterium]